MRCNAAKLFRFEGIKVYYRWAGNLISSSEDDSSLCFKSFDWWSVSSVFDLGRLGNAFWSITLVWFHLPLWPVRYFVTYFVLQRLSLGWKE